MRTCSALPSAVATARSDRVSSIVQGLKSTAPNVTVRPSFSLAIFWTWCLSSGGTASQPSTHRVSTPATAHAARRAHL
jgi:hypothetical protein